MSYEWVGEVDKLVQSLSKKMNNRETRKDVAAATARILNKHKVVSFVDCSATINTAEVINHGEFALQVETQHITFLFRFINNKVKK